MMPEEIPRIFEMFTQLDTSLERSTHGLGIGLALVQSLVEMHGGSITAASPGRGLGSEFVVRLPRAAESRIKSIPAVTAGAPLVTGRRILIVDDNEDAALSLSTLLQLAGNTTQTAADGLQAIAAVESFRPDVVLLDIGMPKMNGYEAARQIRARPCGSTTVLIALTGWGQDEDREKTIAAGFDGHLTKPAEYGAIERLIVEKLPR